MNSVAIIGVGLIGGSFGLALRAGGFGGDVIGVSSVVALASGLKTGAITRTANLEEAASAADLIYLSQPVDRILETLPRLATLARPGALVTDAGSTKSAIVDRAKQAAPSLDFMGGHPLAGKEQRGAEAAQADLFRGRPYVLTPHLPESAAARSFAEWLDRIGAHVLRMSPEAHDRTLAFTSHLPQLISSALALALARQNDSQNSEVFGPGLLAMTRLALSSPELWSPILRTNKFAVSAALEAFRLALVDLQVSLENDSLVELFDIGSTWAAQLRRFEVGPR